MRGLDLRDVFTGAMSWRRLGVILDHLPLDSAYYTSVRNAADPEQMAAPPMPGIFGPWSQSDLLLARAGDLIQSLIYMQADPKTRGTPPKPYPRPGVEAKVRPISPEAAAYLEYKRAHRGEDPPEGWTPDIA